VGMYSKSLCNNTANRSSKLLKNSNMDTSKKTARIAGLFYLVVVLSGLFHLLYVPGKLINWQSPATTLQNIIANETMFRLSLLAGCICYTAFLFLPLVLYKLLSPVNKTHAVAMAALALLSVPLSFVNLLNKFAVLTLISKPEYAVAPPGLATQVMQQLQYYSNGNLVASLFWGLWLLPFGWLVYRSGFLPKVLGVLLMAGCIGYVVNFVGELVFPAGYKQSGIESWISIPGGLGEIGTCLWLLIMGVKLKQQPLQ
jgi:hypothetical protein